MARLKLIDGRLIESGFQLVNTGRPDEEGSRSATALFEGREISVYNSIIDGFNDVWTEQLTIEEWRALSPEEKKRLEEIG